MPRNKLSQHLAAECPVMSRKKTELVVANQEFNFRVEFDTTEQLREFNRGFNEAYSKYGTAEKVRELLFNK